MKTIDQRITEYKKSYEEILPADVIERSAKWWRSELEEVAKEALAEREKEIAEQIEKQADAPPPFSADPDNPMKHCYQNEGYRTALNDIIKTLTK